MGWGAQGCQALGTGGALAEFIVAQGCHGAAVRFARAARVCAVLMCRKAHWYTTAYTTAWDGARKIARRWGREVHWLDSNLPRQSADVLAGYWCAARAP